MSNFGPHDTVELRGVEARSLDLLRALAVSRQLTLAGAVAEALRVAGGNLHYSVSGRDLIGNRDFETALERALPAPGLRTPRPLGPVDTENLVLLRQLMLTADISLPQALTLVITGAGIETDYVQAIAKLRSGDFHQALVTALAATRSAAR